MNTHKTKTSKENFPTSKVAAKKRLAILKAAAVLFSRHGFKRASIDLIAEAAKVAKPTIYAHFEDKDALFAAVCSLFMEQLLESAQRARALPTLQQRVCGILGAKFTMYFEVVLRSPYADELIHATNDLVSDVVEKIDVRYKALLVEELLQCEARRELSLSALQLSADSLADALLQAAHGAGYNAKSAAEHTINVQRLVGLILR
jgi:AcrR family transcriptional regulator